MIVKIQQPLFSSGEAAVLIYNRSRSILLQLPLDPAVKKLLGERPKGYFRAELNPDGALEILGYAADQDW